ncbi:hypothetical protein KJ567_02115 [Candidatus Bipolaricaulota bacterium]|nr:hypothetical protein [Candidatus Bipolaricaulota bacterium]
MRRTLAVEGAAGIYQGLRTGDQIGLWSADDACGFSHVAVYYLDVAGQVFDLNESFRSNVLRTWSSEIEGLQTLLILGAEGHIEIIGRDGWARGENATFRLLEDPGHVLRDQLGLVPQVASIGYLVNAEGEILQRLPPLRLETAGAVFALVAATVEGRELAPTEKRFNVMHPDEADARATLTAIETALEGDVPRLVYIFSPECEPCGLSSRIAADLAASQEGQVQVVGLAVALSAQSIVDVLRCGEEFGHLLASSSRAWLASLPVNEEDLGVYERAVQERLSEYMHELPNSFPCAVDWDRKLAGGLGLGMAQFPTWALFDAGGELLGVFPGCRETVNVDGDMVEAAYPSFQDLLDWIDELPTPSSAAAAW